MYHIILAICNDVFVVCPQSYMFCLTVFCYNRYGDGEVLSPDDQKFVVEKLLAHHPCSEDKIGCGLDAIMVN